MADNNENNLLDEQKALEAVKAIGPGNEVPETPGDTFVRSCIEFLRGWQAAHKEPQRHQEGQPVLLLYSNLVLPEMLRPSAVRKPGFKGAFPLHIGGRVYACNENLKTVYEEIVSFGDETAPLTFLEKEGLQSCTGVVFLPAQDAILVHSSNGDPNNAVRFSLDTTPHTPFKFDELEEYLNRFYKTHVETHNCYCDIWKTASKRVLKHYPERQIQRSLAGFLEFTIGKYGVKTDQEIFTRTGRSDVRLLRYHDEKHWEQAILELKVLFPDKSDEDNVKWAIEGLGQIEGYRKDHEDRTAGSYLCCYDGRKVDTDLPAIAIAAKGRSIEARRYFMKTPGYGL